MNLQDLPGRDSARELAQQELAKRRYEQARPSYLLRAVRALIDKVTHAIDTASASVPGGGLGLLLILAVVGGLVALLLVRLRPTTRRTIGEQALFGDQVLTAREHRERADAAAAAGQLAEAIRERLRAVVRELESRGVLDPRPGRTADEVAREAGRAVPAVAEPLLRAATVFDEVWYGGRTADAAAYQLLVEVDHTVSDARLVRS
ncbi:MAG: putative integral rane protein [Frankiales bacterium]|nr:putative integral rane protein [Frankiales bacterium]